MTDICSKHGPYSVLCRMCDIESEQDEINRLKSALALEITKREEAEAKLKAAMGALGSLARAARFNANASKFDNAKQLWSRFADKAEGALANTPAPSPDAMRAGEKVIEAARDLRSACESLLLLDAASDGSQPHEDAVMKAMQARNHAEDVLFEASRAYDAIQGG